VAYPLCRGTRKDGTPCRANAKPGDDYCIFHSPRCKEDGDRARSLGGTNAHLPRVVSETPDFPLETAKDLARFLSCVINETHKGKLDCKTATAVGALSSSLAKVLSDIKDAEVEERLNELRRLAASRPAVIRNGHHPFLTLTNNETPREIVRNEPDDD
jgi:hypothetical protein